MMIGDVCILDENAAILTGGHLHDTDDSSNVILVLSVKDCVELRFSEDDKAGIILISRDDARILASRLKLLTLVETNNFLPIVLHGMHASRKRKLRRSTLELVVNEGKRKSLEPKEIKLRVRHKALEHPSREEPLIEFEGDPLVTTWSFDAIQCFAISRALFSAAHSSQAYAEEEAS